MLSADDISQLRRLMELRERRDNLKVEYEAAKKDYADAEMELYERLSDGPVSRLNNVDLGEPWGKVSFGSREQYFARVIKGMEDEALEYFRQRARLDEVTEPRFTMARLNEEVRHRRETNEPMPPGIDFYARRGVTVTKEK